MHRIVLLAALAALAFVGWLVFRYHALIIETAIIAGIVAVTIVLTRATVEIARLPAGSRHHFWVARWHAFRWRWVARNLGLSYIDKHRRARPKPVPVGTSATITARPELHREKLRYPRARFRPDPYGFRVQLRTVPGVGRAEVEKQAEHLANCWGAWRVSVTQRKPGRLELRGFRTDPLAERLDVAELPAFDGRHVTLGRDELGELRPVSLANHSGSCWCGNPGRGKTEAALSLAWQLAPSPAVELWIADGGELDWAPFAPGAARYETELAGVVDMLHDLDAGMNERRRNLEAQLGVRNAWALGPSADYPLRWLVIEEAPAFLQVPDKRGERKDLADEAHGLVVNLLRRGRAPLYHTSLITQKATTTGGLHPDLRDLCGLRWSFGVATVDGAASILGADIREYPAACPTQLQGPEHVGTATALLRTGMSPYTLIKFPAVGQDRADQVAAQVARRRSAGAS
jgi:hypothetical protein